LDEIPATPERQITIEKVDFAFDSPVPVSPAPTRSASKPVKFGGTPKQHPNAEQLEQFRKTMESRKEKVDRTATIHEGQGKRTATIEKSVFKVGSSVRTSSPARENFTRLQEESPSVEDTTTSPAPEEVESVVVTLPEEGPLETIPNPIEDEVLVRELHNAEDQVSDEPPPPTEEAPPLDKKALASELREVLKATKAQLCQGVDLVKVGSRGDRVVRRIALRNNFLCSESKGLVGGVKGWHCWHVMQIENLNLGMDSPNFDLLLKQLKPDSSFKLSPSMCCVVRFVNEKKPLCLIFPDDESRNRFVLLFRVLKTECAKQVKSV